MAVKEKFYSDAARYKSDVSGDDLSSLQETLLKERGMPSRSSLNLYKSFYRFGVYRPYDAPDTGREYLFFVKPDLCIVNRPLTIYANTDFKQSKGDYTNYLQKDLQNNPFFIELARRWPNVITQLQYQADSTKNPFSTLLSNMVASNLDLPSLSGNTITTPTNIFGTNYDYRGTSEPSDDNFDFSLEFNDTRWLDVYMYFRAYEEYERLKAQGYIRLYGDKNGTIGNKYARYIGDKILHDQFGIYKFIVESDMETIIHYAYYTGVMWKSLPRDNFNNPDFSEGLKFAVDGKAAFVDDMDPIILRDFNKLVYDYCGGTEPAKKGMKYKPVVNPKEDPNTDLTPAKIPYVYQGYRNNKIVYKLAWFG